MTGTWQAFNGKYATFFRRQVVSIDTSTVPHRITIDIPLRYTALVSNDARIRRVSGLIHDTGIRDLGLANATNWESAWSHDRAHVLEFNHAYDAYIENVYSFNPPSAPTNGLGSEDHLQSGGVIIRFSKRVTMKNSDMREAQHRGSGGNGYLFEVMQSSDVLFDSCVAHAGRHNFIQNWGFGTTGCVWTQCVSTGGEAWFTPDIPFGITGYSEYHHSLATANLVDGGIWNDGFSAVNRGDYSSGAGHTSTQSVFWAPQGTGVIASRKFGMGYVIGAGPDISILSGIDTTGSAGSGTAPEDWVEGAGLADTLEPSSLYSAQLLLRLSSDE